MGKYYMHINKKGDVSRRRRLVGPPAKIAWYAFCRALRFAVSDFRQHHHGDDHGLDRGSMPTPRNIT